MNFSNASIGGRVAVAGDATLSGFSIGGSPSAGTGVSLVVGGFADLSGGSLAKGAQATRTNAPDYMNVTVGPSPIDFLALDTELTTQSNLLAGLAANGTTIHEHCRRTLKGNDAGLNVFTLSAIDMAGACNLVVSVPENSTTLINVTGPSFTLASMGISILESKQTLWNFADATAISLSSVGFSGSILAPNAVLTFTNGSFNGQAVLGGLSSSSVAFNHTPFAGAVFTDPVDVPAAVPEPSTLLLVATGGAAALWYRRRRPRR